MSIREDKKYMRRCLALARLGAGRAHPNPMVGAVVVRGGRVVGEGFHGQAGGPHAETVALRKAGKKAEGAVLYVSLEPCCHIGKTPPCTDLIIRSGIRRVVSAMPDPNPAVLGKGHRVLKRHGIDVATGLLKIEAVALNDVFITWQTLRRPYVTVKVAQSLDGKIATGSGQSKWISGIQARQQVQQIRSEVDGILVGVETVLADDPRLTVRGSRQKAGRRRVALPVKIVLDSKLRTPPTARIFHSGGRVVIATTHRADVRREHRLVRSGAQVLRLPARGQRVQWAALLEALAERGIAHLLIEGGAEVMGSAFDAGCVDRLICFISPKVIGGRKAPSSVGGKGASVLSRALNLKECVVCNVGEDLMITGRF